MSKYPKINVPSAKPAFNVAAKGTPPAPKAKPINPPQLVIPPPKLGPGRGSSFVSPKASMAKAEVSRQKTRVGSGQRLSAAFNKSSAKKI